MRRDGSGSALRGVGSCPRSSRSRSRRGIGGDKRKDRQRPKTRDCRGWASPFRTDGRRKAGGPSGGSGGRGGPRSTCETDGTKKFQRAKEPSVGKQSWRCGSRTSYRLHEPVGKKCFCHCSLDEVCHGDELLKGEPGPGMTVHQDVPGRSRPRHEVASSCPEERASSVGGKLRVAAQRPRAGGAYRKAFSPFRSRFAPQRLKYRSRSRQEGLNLARPKGRRRHLTSTFKKPALEAWTFSVTWALNFVYSARHGERTERPETS